ncbi:VOC family protein [Paenibacillus sp. Z6-24]
MKLSMKYIILYVNDFEQSMRFYRDILGLPIKMEAGTYVEFDTGATTLSINTRESVNELLDLGLTADVPAASSFEVGFVVEDVSAVIEELRSQDVPVIREPVTKPWGQTVAYVTDPDGHFIEICTAVG